MSGWSHARGVAKLPRFQVIFPLAALRHVHLVERLLTYQGYTTPHTNAGTMSNK